MNLHQSPVWALQTQRQSCDKFLKLFRKIQSKLNHFWEHAEKLGMGWNAIIAIWIITTSVLMMSLHSWHSFVFSVDESKIPFTILQSKSQVNTIHFIAEGCSCSIPLVKHLAQRKATEEVFEKVIIVGKMNDSVRELKNAGYVVESMSFEKAREGGWLSATPLLVVYDREQKVHYAGGYAEGVITPLTQFYDQSIIEDVKNNALVKSNYPIRGCAAAKNLQAMLDPFGLKYKGNIQ